MGNGFFCSLERDSLRSSLRQALRAVRCAATVKAAARSRFRLVPRPLVMVWEATDRCNGACSYCRFAGNRCANGRDLDTTEIKRILDDACSLGLFGLVVSGGEPLLRDDLRVVINHARRRGLWVSLTTNGTLLQGLPVENLAHCQHLTISVDSTNPDVYARRRGIDRFYAVRNALDRVLSFPHSPVTHVQAVLDSSNWRTITDLNEYFHARGADTVFQLRHGERFCIDVAEWRRRVNRLLFHSGVLGWVQRRFLSLFPGIASGRSAPPCLALTSNFLISADGLLLHCNFRREPLADLRRESLTDAWLRLGTERRRVRTAAESCVCANTCFMIPALLLS
ncbi:MAG: radical SAM protein [Candidatus Eisenbacteria bacterium]